MLSCIIGIGKRSETKIQHKRREKSCSLLKGKQNDLIVPQSYTYTHILSKIFTILAFLIRPCSEYDKRHNYCVFMYDTNKNS